LNLGLQAGQTIKINLSGKLGDQKREKPKAQGTGGLLLPPPPSGKNPSSVAPTNQIAPPNDDEFGDFGSASSGNQSGWVSF